MAVALSLDNFMKGNTGMKKTVVSVFSFLLASALALSASARSWAPMMQAAQATPTPKVIQNAAEGNAYMAAFNTADPTAKAAAMEAFIKQYPNSIMKSDALNIALDSYEKANNPAKAMDVASRMLQDNPNDITALFALTYYKRAQATTPAAFAEVLKYGQAGANALPAWQKPAGESDADYAKQVNQMKSVFYGAEGFGYLQQKDYTHARDAYTQAVQADPTSLQDIYQLGITDLSLDPVDIKGFWYVAKAANLAGSNAQVVATINAYGKGQYRRYHGGDDGWDPIVTAAASQPTLPADFTVKPKPTAADLACQAAKDNDPAQLGFSDREYILQFRDASPCNKDAAAKVWAAILAQQGTNKLKIPIKVITATADTITGALSEDNQKDNKADVQITMEKPLVKLPVVGSNIDVVGTFSDYTPNPFLFIMTAGELPVKTPVHPTHPTHK